MRFNTLSIEFHTLGVRAQTLQMRIKNLKVRAKSTVFVSQQQRAGLPKVQTIQTYSIQDNPCRSQN